MRKLQSRQQDHLRYFPPAFETPKRLGFSLVSSTAPVRSCNDRQGWRRRDPLGCNVVAVRALWCDYTTVVAAAASSAVPKSIISIVYRFFFPTFPTSAKPRAFLVFYAPPCGACAVLADRFSRGLVVHAAIVVVL